MAEAWYVIRSKPRKEDLLAEQLRMNSIDSFNPRIRVQTVNPRARKMRPYFPGYLFVRADLERTGFSTLQWMSGAIGLVCFGGEPAHVPDALIQAIRKRLLAIDPDESDSPDGMNPGERIMVHRGPFAGYEAIFDSHLSGNERVRVLLNLLSNQQVPLELPASQIRRKMLSHRQFIQSIP